MGWVEVELGEVAEIKGGKRLPKGCNLQAEKTSFPYIRVTDFDNGSINTENLKYLDEETYKLIQNYTISKDDLYISIAGTIGLVGEIPDFLDGANLTENSAKICEIKGINKSLLKYYLNSLQAIQQFDNKITSSGQPKLALFRIRNCIIPLPPKAEQDHIATLLDNHLSQVATISQKLNDILPIIKQFRQSVLAQAVSGKLTEDWRENNRGFSAKDDYESYLILENHKDKITKEKIKLRQDKKFQIENHQIESWITLPFFELSLLNRGFDLPASQRIEGEYPIISSSGHNGTHNQFTVKAPCITVGRSGSVGKVFYCNQDCWALNTALYVKSFGFSDPKFIYWKLVSMDLAQYSSSTAVPTLNRNEFMFEPVSVPPLTEQQQIVTEVERLFAVADSIETQVKEALERVGHLTQSILHQAFTGNLSADWRACNADLITGEHSATALLAQIKQAEPKSPRKKKAQ